MIRAGGGVAVGHTSGRGGLHEAHKDVPRGGKGGVQEGSARGRGGNARGSRADTVNRFTGS